MIGSDLLRYRPDQPYLGLDTETEGLNYARSRPWQLSYAICSLTEVQTMNVRHLDWPDLAVSERAAIVTRFDMARHKSIAEPPKEVAADFRSLLLDPRYLIFGHNLIGFDSKILDRWLLTCGFPSDWSFLSRVLDTHALAKAYFKGIAPDRSNLLVWQYRLLSIREKGLKTSLGAMCREFKIPYDEARAHDAAYDTTVNLAVLKELVWKLEL